MAEGPGPPAHCAVCLDPVAGSAQLPCGHALHTACLALLRDHRHSRCPLCRTPLAPAATEGEGEEGPPPGGDEEEDDFASIVAAFARAARAPRDLDLAAPRDWPAVELPLLYFARAADGPYAHPRQVLVDWLLHMYVVCDNPADGSTVAQMFSHNGSFVQTVPLPAEGPVRSVACTAVGLLCYVAGDGQGSALHFWLQGHRPPPLPLPDIVDPTHLVVHPVTSSIYVVAGSTTHVFERTPSGYAPAGSLPLAAAPSHVALCHTSNALVALDDAKRTASFVCLATGVVLSAVSYDRLGLTQPRGVAITPEGHLAIADVGAVRLAQRDGQPLHAFPAHASAALDWLPEPCSVAVGRDGRLVVAEARRQAVFVC